MAAALAEHPQAIVGEMDARTSATFLSELRQQHGSLIPFVVTQRALRGDWAAAVVPALGGSTVSKYVTTIAPQLQASGTAYAAFQSAMTAAKANPFQKKNPFVAASYDGVIAFALAMDAAKSTDASAFVSYIPKVTTPGSGATVVARATSATSLSLANSASGVSRSPPSAPACAPRCAP